MGFLSKAKQSDKIHKVHFIRSNILLLYFYEKQSLAEVLLTHQKKNGFVEFHHFMKKERLNNSSKTFFNQWEPMGFRKLQTKKKCEEISTTRLRHVNKH